MDVIVATVRLKKSQQPHHQPHASAGPDLYEILLLDVPLSASSQKNNRKYLPKATITHEEEPSDFVLQYIYDATGSENGGLKGLRSLYVCPQNKEVAHDGRESYTRGSLFCIPVDSREKLNPSFVDPTSPRFYSLETILMAMNTGTMSFTKQTVFMISRLESWLKDTNSLTGSVEAMFRKPADQRIESSVFNPAFVSSMIYSKSVENLDQAGITGIQIANDALARMMAVDKCDKVVINPLFGSGLPYKHSVDAIAVNQFWGHGTPDYGSIRIPSDSRDGSSSSVSDASLQDEMKIFKYAWEGNAQGVRELLEKGVSANQRDQNSWAPLHFAVWYGHLEVIQALVTEGNGNPNITNKKRATPLHFAALSGQEYVVELLLSHPEIDVLALDREGQTALNTCENKTSEGHQACAKLLEKAENKPFVHIAVHLMNGSSKQLRLVSGPNTTVHQLHLQMLKELQIPDQCAGMFTIWICSKSLQLQLKKEHRPIEHLQNWGRIIASLTDVNPGKEGARLEWRRDARLTIHQEQAARNAVTTTLLYHEAYYHYIRSLYPCSDEDAVELGALLMQLNHGDYDARKSKTILSSRKSLAELIPPSKSDVKGTNWVQKIQGRYKQFTEHLQTKDKLKHTYILQCKFLMVCWNLVVYGSAFFTGSAVVKSNKLVSIHIGVNDVGIHVIQNHNRQSNLQTFHYKDIEWNFVEVENLMEVKPKGSSRGTLALKTKQAGLIDHLMKKMFTASVEISQQ